MALGGFNSSDIYFFVFHDIFALMIALIDKANFDFPIA